MSPRVPREMPLLLPLLLPLLRLLDLEEAPPETTPELLLLLCNGLMHVSTAFAKIVSPCEPIVTVHAAWSVTPVALVKGVRKQMTPPTFADSPLLLSRWPELKLLTNS
eukprot:gnl/TRDRNA2_/TRDRNA2_175939_c0_seq4.p2 gnl/TRDRNA2_/TRDRNA2_175939_c0~~gnl/TRDRNA2_/TRDRNA2_175939_c0_seq4.p2  ORF type:complete len:108 (-),score=18.31 gnl/TRDRNA2_/TRDRNA2_175939_c0_seq4:8-331(-)